MIRLGGRRPAVHVKAQKDGLELESPSTTNDGLPSLALFAMS